MEQNGTKKFFLGILISLSLVHGLNDVMQSLISSMYPILKENMNLSYAQIGIVALTFLISSSLMQPLFGYIFDTRSSGWFLPFGLTSTLAGLTVASFSNSFGMLLCGVFLSGMGSAVIHPEASRITSLAAGNKRGLAQSIFQMGGTCGYSLGPLLAANFVHNQNELAKFTVVAVAAFIAMIPACRWYSARIRANKAAAKSAAANGAAPAKSAAPALENANASNALPRKTAIWTVTILMFLVFSKNFYTVSLSNYYMFYLMHKFGVSVQTAQTMLFAFLFAGACGIIVGGPVGDRIGRRLVIWWSILGSAPFALLMPYLNLPLTIAASMAIGFIISSAFSAILVYAQELLPMKVGMISGIFFGFSFGVAGISSAVLGVIADKFGIDTVYTLCSFVPLFGAAAYFLPRMRTIQDLKQRAAPERP